jgi:hypothetical protein
LSFRFSFEVEVAGADVVSAAAGVAVVVDGVGEDRSVDLVVFRVFHLV